MTIEDLFLDISPASIDREVLLGVTQSHILASASAGLSKETTEALAELASDAAQSGIDLRVASGFRSFERQQFIWDQKWLGHRAVLNDADETLFRADQSDNQWLCAILRFSALPGTSRHHWGTDLDVYDAAAMDAEDSIALTVTEARGRFSDLHRWLDERMARDQSCGFFRPYELDRGGVSPEPWHLSYAPLATGYEGQLTSKLWIREIDERELVLQGLDCIRSHIDMIFERFVTLPKGWCPERYRSGRS